MNGDCLYSTTIYRGREWLWDLRNTSKKLGLIEARSLRNSIKLLWDNLYSVGDSGFLTISPTLMNYEILPKKAINQTNAKSSVVFSKWINGLVWCVKEPVYYTEIDLNEPNLEEFKISKVQKKNEPA